MNTRTISLIVIAGFAFLVASLQHLAYQYFFYWTIWWYDIPMHFLGGVVIGASVSWFVFFLLPDELKKIFFTRAWILSAVFVVGMAWETFEVRFGVSGSIFMPYFVDTIKDLFMDLAGGGSAYLLCSRIWDVQPQ